MRQSILRVTLLTFSLIWACSPQDVTQPESTPLPQTDEPGFVSEQSSDNPQLPDEVLTIMTHGCLPCHAQDALNALIQKTQTAHFESAGDMTRERIINALQKLQGEKQEGSVLNFSTPEQILAYISTKPQTFIGSLENNTMPPEWAENLAQEIDTMGYRPISVDERIILLKYSRSLGKAQ